MEEVKLGFTLTKLIPEICREVKSWRTGAAARGGQSFYTVRGNLVNTHSPISASDTVGTCKCTRWEICPVRLANSVSIHVDYCNFEEQMKKL